MVPWTAPSTVAAEYGIYGGFPTLDARKFSTRVPARTVGITAPSDLLSWSALLSDTIRLKALGLETLATIN
jgi:hypothetical protein